MKLTVNGGVKSEKVNLMGTESKYYLEIINKLEKFVKKEYFLFAAIGIQGAVLTGILIYTSFTFSEAFFHFDSIIRTILFLIFLFFTTGVFVFLFIIPVLKYFSVFRKTDYFAVAKKTGKNFPAIKDDLLNAMQLVSKESNRNSYSPVLIDAAFQNVYEKTKPVQFESVIKFDKAKELLKYLSGIAGVCIILFTLVPSMQAAGFRLINFRKEFIPPAKYTFVIEPGDRQITKGDNIRLSVKVNGALPKNVWLGIKEIEQTKYELQNLNRDSLGYYNYEINSVRSSFRYFAKADDITSEEFNIAVIDRPVIQDLNFKILSPAYSRIPQTVQKDNGNISALTGSRVDVNINSTKKLKSAKMIFSDSSVVPMKISGNHADGLFKIKNDGEYKILITDENNNGNLSPITYSLKALADNYPSINLITPDVNINLPADNRVNILSHITDDYGFSKLILNYRLTASKYKEIQSDYSEIELQIDRNSTESDIPYVWNLSTLRLSENDVVTYFLEVFDNDNVSGPKSAKSASLTIRIPSLDELLTQADKTQDKAVDDLQKTLQEAEDLKKDIEKITQDLKQDKKDITWQEKEKIEKTLDQFKKLQEKSEQISKKIDELKKNLQENNLLSPETQEKYSEMQKLFDSLSSDAMKKAMENMQNVLQNLDRQQIQQAMENYKFDEEQFRASIERTMNLLKRIQVEQKVNDLLNRIDELTKKQDELQNDTKNSDGKNKDELSEKQGEISKELNDLKKDMEKLSEKMSELKDLPKDELDKLQEEFDQQNNQQLSEDASKQLQQNLKQMAMQNQQQLFQNMQKMKEGMQNLQQSMTQKNQVQTFLDMMKLTNNLISLSKDQEGLRKESAQMDPNSSEFRGNAEKQNIIQNNLNKIMNQMAELSQKTFAITPEMGKSLGDAQREMRKSMEALQNRNGKNAELTQGLAMKGLNEAAELMKNSMESMMNGQGGQGGMMSLMQQMGQLSQQQMNLNNLTQMLQQAMSGSLSQQQQAQLQRLGQQQEAIRKSLAELNKEAKASGKSKTLTSNMERMLNEMQEVIKDMSTEKVDDNLVQKQEHILSKMLDAQRSMNERDFEKNRESFAGKNITRESPAELNFSTQKGKDKLRDELIKAIQEGYSKDYEELIKKYYEALQKENIKK